MDSKVILNSSDGKKIEFSRDINKFSTTIGEAN